MTHPADALQAAILNLSDKDADFAHSLLNGYRRYGNFTEKQLHWVHVLIERARPAAKQHKLDLTELNAMFAKAAIAIKRPKVVFLTEDGERFSVSPAGSESRNPGFLYVKSRTDGYLGKIDPTGNFQGARGIDAAKAQAALVLFCRDPEGQARLFGQKTGECCFCARELTDARSVSVGYGPICADRYGLPWGSVTCTEEAA